MVQFETPLEDTEKVSALLGDLMKLSLPRIEPQEDDKDRIEPLLVLENEEGGGGHSSRSLECKNPNVNPVYRKEAW
jgi:hypothetical protein